MNAIQELGVLKMNTEDGHGRMVETMNGYQKWELAVV